MRFVSNKVYFVAVLVALSLALTATLVARHASNWDKHALFKIKLAGAGSGWAHSVLVVWVAVRVLLLAPFRCLLLFSM